MSAHPEVRAFAPGRVTLVGEHTDYNGGLSLPFAIGDGVTVLGRPLGGGRIVVHATDLGERDAFPAADPPRADGWRAFARGIAAELAAAGHRVVPAEPARRLPLERGMAVTVEPGVSFVPALSRTPSSAAATATPSTGAASTACSGSAASASRTTSSSRTTAARSSPPACPSWTDADARARGVEFEG